MNELTKTLLFVGVAAVSVAGAFLGRPSQVGTETPDDVGNALFAEMTDPLAAKSLEIVEFDIDRGKARTFNVEQRQGVWVLPAYENYPADATDNLQAAANMFVDLKVVNVAGDEKSAHADYGVLDPSTDAGDGNDEDLGKLVRIKDDKGGRLVELIIGKEVPNSEGQRFVRRPSQDRVYTVALQSDSLSTKFEDWVVQDVLSLDAMQIKQIAIRDYSVTPVMSQRGGMQLMQDERLNMTVSWNGDDFKWDLDELLEWRNKKMLPTELLEDEELDKDVLDELKNALADLKIIDVVAKPKELREGLKGSFERLAQDREGQQSLVDRGFYPVGIAEGGIEIASTDGEVSVKTNDNVQYELYFGEVAAGASSEDAAINRFVMIAAKIDEAAIPKPELADVPELAGPVAVEGEDADEIELTEEQKAANVARDAIIKENERKQNEYDDAMTKAKEKVAELNFRLADWYYVVSEEVYNDIHLSRKDVVSTKEGSTEAGFGADAFRKLEEEGLKREEESAATAAGAPATP